MKTVSFEVAKVLKEAGYPQGNKNSGDCAVYPLEDHNDNYTPYTRIGKITTRYTCETWRILSSIPYVIAPTAIDVWLWLWRVKKIRILFDDDYVEIPDYSYCEFQKDYTDPEEAIEKAIVYLVENNLIK